MIGRYIFVKLKAPFSNESGRRNLSEKCLQFFARSPFVQKTEVGIPCDASSTTAWDLSIVLYFKDKEMADSFLGAADAATFNKEQLQANAVVTKAWNFAVTSQSTENELGKS